MCKDRLLCSEKDYFQIHTACDQEGKVRQRRPPRELKHPATAPSCLHSVPLHHASSLCLFRRRSCISGSSLRYAWRALVDPSRSLRVENENPAPHVTLVSTTMTRQPAPPAPLGPIPMGQNVLRLRICIERQPYLYGLLNQLNSNRVFHCTLPTACSQCPAGTEPTLGYEYKWWNVLPANMKASCFNVGNLKCDSMNGGCLFCISVK